MKQTPSIWTLSQLFAGGMLVNQQHTTAWWTRSFADKTHIAKAHYIQPFISSRHTSQSIATNANPAPQHVLSATAQQPSPAPAQTPSNWHEPLSTILWQGSESEARKRLPQGMSPPWKVMLLSDGSVTRHLQLLTDLPVQVDCLEMRNVGICTEGLPPGVEAIPGPRTQRQVLLRLPDLEKGSKGAMVYACSWWDAAHVSEYLKDSSRPIWESLSQGRTELYRDIQQVYCGHSDYLEAAFQTRGPFWGRHYVFWHNGKPLTLIYEVFSTALEQYLGPCGHQ